MDDSSDTGRSERLSQDSQEMGKWARVYAQNRSLGVLVSLVVSTLLFLAIGGGSFLGGFAWRHGNMPVFWACMAWLAVATAGVIYCSVPWWGGRALERLARRLYAGDGGVALDIPQCNRRLRLMIPLGITFFVCVLLSVSLGVAGFIPIEYMQPVSASYCVPFLVGLVFLQRPAVSYVALLWPLLYGLHAILILAGAPIRFTGAWQALDVTLPMVGYGILSAMASHLYGRFALRRLKKLARTGDSISPRTGEVTRP